MSKRRSDAPPPDESDEDGGRGGLYEVGPLGKRTLVARTEPAPSVHEQAREVDTAKDTETVDPEADAGTKS
jgi:hypothetical protein